MAALINPRTIRPLDSDTILASVHRAAGLGMAEESRNDPLAVSPSVFVAADPRFAARRSRPLRLTVAERAIPCSQPLGRRVVPDWASSAVWLPQPRRGCLRLVAPLGLSRLAMNKAAGKIAARKVAEQDRFGLDDLRQGPETPTMTTEVPAPCDWAAVEILASAGETAPAGA